MIDPPRWDDGQFEIDRQEAISIFRRSRLEEPLEAYLEEFERYCDVFENLLEMTVDLTQLRQHGLEILSDKALREAFRYLTCPPISLDDLKTVAEVDSFTKDRLVVNPNSIQRIVDMVLSLIDRRRFPWVSDGSDPSEPDRRAAVLASASLVATQRIGTNRRSEGTRAQEQWVEDQLMHAGFEKVSRRSILALPSAPERGQFCGESRLGSKKADFIIRLYDHRVMALECKVSNSATNSVKRLNGDAAIKAEVWRRDFGTTQIVPTAVISGVYKLHNLIDAQQRGLTIFWSHDLQPMLDWIARTESPR